jgi:hypothetical protein
MKTIMSRRTISALAVVAVVSACGHTQERHVAANHSASVAVGGGMRSDLRVMAHSAPKLSLDAAELSVRPPSHGWHTESIWWFRPIP